MRSFLTSVIVGFAVFSAPLAAQEIVTTPLEDVPLDELIGQLVITPTEPAAEDYLSSPQEAVAVQVQTANAGELRVLDKLTGDVVDVSLELGQTATLGFLAVTLNECRYPADNPAGDAFTQLIVRDDDGTLFSGWMLASAPALNAMDHPRYDVWALRCITS